MRLFLVAALVCFIIGLLIAAGVAIVSTWPVWAFAGFIALTLEWLVGYTIPVATRRTTTAPAAPTT